MADLVHLSLASGPDPTLAGHYATKSYVDAGRGDMSINARTAAYTLVAGDRGKVVEVSNAATVQVTVPLNSAVPYPVGTIIRVRKTGAGNVVVAGTAGVTINWASTFTIITQYAMAEIHKVGTDQWRGVLLGT